MTNQANKTSLTNEQSSPVMITIPAKTLNRIKQKTEINAHGEAYVLASKCLGKKNLVEVFNSINTEQKRVGHLPLNLYEKRQVAYLELLKVAKSTLQPACYNRLYLSL